MTVSVVVPLTDKERQTLDELAAKQDLSPARVMIQALRLYQSVALGVLKVVETDPLPKLAPAFAVGLDAGEGEEG